MRGAYCDKLFGWGPHYFVCACVIPLRCIACWALRRALACSLRYVPAGAEFDVNGEIGHVDIDGEIAIHVALSCIALNIVEFACAT
jgi:hypothetical protein